MPRGIGYGPKVGSKQFGQRAEQRREAMAGKPGGPAKKSHEAAAISERQRQEKGAGLTRPNLRKR